MNEYELKSNNNGTQRNYESVELNAYLFIIVMPFDGITRINKINK